MVVIAGASVAVPESLFSSQTQLPANSHPVWMDRSFGKELPGRSFELESVREWAAA